jgi:hypothetical protein
VENLLAADKGFSTSHMANGATRLQPLILNIGQAAGAAAALAVARGLTPAQLPVRAVQEALLHDPQAPAAVVPLWDTPWHHPAWRQRQLAVLDDPTRIGADGRWGGPESQADQPCTAPPEPHEQAWTGTVIPDGEGGFSLALGADRCLPLITLEPSLHAWLNTLCRPTPTTLVGCLNTAGPWLRVSRLAA